MIPRYTRAEMARIWSDENRFRNWLAVEVAATETLAEAGIVPKDAARAIKERADFKVERIHAIEAEVKHDVIAFTTAVAEIVGPARAVVSLRADIERRSGYRASTADQASLRGDRSGSRAACRCARAARVGIQRHAHDRPNSWHPRRAHHIRVQDRQLVFGNAAQHHAVCGRGRRYESRKIFRRRRGRLPISRPK